MPAVREGNLSKAALLVDTGNRAFAVLATPGSQGIEAAIVGSVPVDSAGRRGTTVLVPALASHRRCGEEEEENEAVELHRD